MASSFLLLGKTTVGAKPLAREKLIVRLGVLCLALASSVGGSSFVDGRATSANGGFRDFIASSYLLEDDENESYCYPAVIAVKDGFLVAYYHSNGADNCLNCTRITKVLYEELQ